MREMSREERLEMEAALQSMTNAGNAIVELYNNGSKELRDKFDTEYTFDNSFDEIVAKIQTIKEHFDK